MYLLFDVGGTKIRISSSYDGVNLDEVKIYDATDFEGFLNYIDSPPGQKVDAIAGGIAGVLDKEKGKLVRSPNLQDWVNVPIKNLLVEKFKAPVFLVNDAALAGLGEACFGAGSDKKIVAYLTISTGIGGCRIVNRHIDEYLWGFEPGKQIIDFDLTMWPECVNFNPDNIPPGSSESYFSGAALNFRWGQKPYEIKDPVLWENVESLLAVTINNVVVFWSPETVVLGGGMISEGAINLEKVSEKLNRMVRIFPDIPDLRKAKLVDKSALFGGLVMIKEKLNF